MITKKFHRLYKVGVYEAITLAINSETIEQMVYRQSR